MFTGIVEEVGRVEQVPAPGRAGSLRIRADRVLEGTRLGDSIAVMGVCLTVTELSPTGFSADVMPQTLSQSSLGALRAGSPVNLERAMAADGRFGGHIVSGHIDGTGRIRRLKRDQNAVRITVEAPRDILALVVPQGSITIDGISLTVSNLFADAFEVSIIPHTFAETTLGVRKPGDAVNLENDVVGKYVRRLLEMGAAAGPPGEAAADGSAPGANRDDTGLSLEFLAANGF